MKERARVEAIGLDRGELARDFADKLVLAVMKQELACERDTFAARRIIPRARQVVVDGDKFLVCFLVE